MVYVSGNGFIEAGELDDFLAALWKEGHSEKVKSRSLLNISFMSGGGVEGVTSF